MVDFSVVGVFVERVKKGVKAMQGAGFWLVQRSGGGSVLVALAGRHFSLLTLTCEDAEGDRSCVLVATRGLTSAYIEILIESSSNFNLWICMLL